MVLTEKYAQCISHSPHTPYNKIAKSATSPNSLPFSIFSQYHLFGPRFSIGFLTRSYFTFSFGIECYCGDFKSVLFYPCAYAEVESLKFFRLDDAKVLHWLCYKVCVYLLLFLYYYSNYLVCITFKALKLAYTMLVLSNSITEA